ncbi:winged helix-turn-helix domain-containing protein [Methanococcoides alaskense]|uniref:Transcriptional regulator n=1 Tax=Methanococcoides alaskense TaxID=325778 RepID=A0AA90U124_9EURY|nr:winged helix-turn-helix domain-containing protein [Methanococcoides alaskense]MCD4800565.1 winged helix-turn-helix transcriptional regulator [Methanococcoides sp.]MCD4822754.1 winged helix-turn-helix transcriptional regulator [Methanococcoides sp.]MDA0524497.1 winged helix-turn-helix transcriptional regulator [Methanococcoides alaskense]MDR6223319.1 putative transcriptional regulator [Methanococcoides alaskense]
MKPFQKRSRLEIIRDILKVIRESNNSISPTKLQRFSNLSFQMFEEYVNDLEKKGLIEAKPYKEKRKIYSLTDKGRAFLDKYQDFVNFLADFGL